MVEQEQAQNSENAESQDSREHQETQASAKPNGWVEFSTPEQQKAFNNVYKQARAAEERIKDFIVHQDQLEQALDRAQQQINQLAGRQETREQNEALSFLRAKLKEAQASGEDDKIAELVEAIADFKVEQKLRSREVERAQTENVRQPAKPSPAVTQALQKEEAYLEVLASENDDYGQPVRPWMQKNHPQYEYVMDTAINIQRQLFDKTGKVPTIKKLMDEVDKAMGIGSDQSGGRRQSLPDVLPGGNLTGRGKSKINLSEDERSLMKRLAIKDEQKFVKRMSLIGNNYTSLEAFE